MNNDTPRVHRRCTRLCCVLRGNGLRYRGYRRDSCRLAGAEEVSMKRESSREPSN